MTLSGNSAGLRLGAILPSVNTVIEPLYWRHLPDHVSLLSTRIFLGSPLTNEGLIAMREDVQGAGRCLASCHVDVVLYLCTASAFAGDPDGEAKAMLGLEEMTGAPVVTVLDAIHDACQTLEMSRVVLVSPYPESFEAAEVKAFDDLGIHTVAQQSFGIDDSFELATPTPEEIFELAKATWRDDADGFLITCANFHSQEIIERLENEFSVPVVTSTQAPLWKALRVGGFEQPIPGWGRLFSH